MRVKPAPRSNSPLKVFANRFDVSGFAGSGSASCAATVIGVIATLHSSADGRSSGLRDGNDASRALLMAVGSSHDSPLPLATTMRPSTYRNTGNITNGTNVQSNPHTPARGIRHFTDSTLSGGDGAEAHCCWPRSLCSSPPTATAAATDFNDSHFHLTNYIQGGTDVRAF